MKPNKKTSTERVYELIMEEHEYNPIVGTAFFETKEFLVSLGFTLPAATNAVLRVEQVYDLNLYRRPNGHNHKDSGDVVYREFGVTRAKNKSVYSKMVAFYLKRIRSGMTQEQVIKAMHEHYDPILGKNCADESQTGQIAIPLSGRALYQERLKTCEYCDIEF